MSEESHDAENERIEAVHRLLKEPLLDLLYRLERLEAAADPSHEGFRRIPSFETGPEQDAALAEMAIRLAALEQKFEDES